MAQNDDPRKGPILSFDEAMQGCYFMFRMMGAQQRAKLLQKMRDAPDAKTNWSRQCLIKLIIQYEADAAAHRERTIVITGPGQLPPDIKS